MIRNFQRKIHNHNNMSNTEQIWYRDLVGFLDVKRLGQICFRKHDAIEVKLNNMLRLSLYYSIILCIVLRKSWGVTIAAALALVSYAVYESSDAAVLPRGDAEREGTRHPSPDNPYMNANALSPDAKHAGNAQAPDVQREMKQLHDEGVPSDARDVFGRNTSDRSFYTMPCTDSVNDQEQFAKWLFRPNDGVMFKERGVLFNQ